MGNLDLIDWTMETARGLRTPNGATTAPVNGSESPPKSDDWLLMSGSGASDTEHSVAEQPAGHVESEPPAIASNQPIAIAPEPIAPEPVVLEPAVLEPIAPEPAVLEPAVATPPADQHSSLLQAIVDPDIYTSKADRYRAIDLRWVLRDIAADRLKSSPINRLDLQILIDIKLVELRGGIPHLTNAGVTAII